jgi:hypothetical protein
MNYIQHLKNSFSWTQPRNAHHKPTIYIIGTDEKTKTNVIEQFTKISLKTNKNIDNKNVVYMTIKPIVKKVFENNIKNSYKITSKNHIEVFNTENEHLELNIQSFPTLSINMSNKNYNNIVSTMQHIDIRDIIICIISYSIEDINNNMCVSTIKRLQLEKNTMIIFVIPNEISCSQLNIFINTNIKKYLVGFFGYSIIINEPIHNNNLLDNYETHNVAHSVNDNDGNHNNVIVGIDNITKNINKHYEQILTEELIPSTKSMIKTNIEQIKKNIDELGIEPVLITKLELYYVYEYIVIPLYIEYYKKIDIDVHYKDTYDFNIYFENVIKFIENIKEIDIDFKNINNLFEFTKDEKGTLLKYQLWRFSSINKTINSIVLKIFKKKMIEYITISKSFMLFNSGNNVLKKSGKIFNEILKIKKIVVTEMLKQGYEHHQYIQNIEEANEIFIKRNKFKDQLNHYTNILNDLRTNKMSLLSQSYIFNKNKDTYYELYEMNNLSFVNEQKKSASEDL